VEAAVTNLSPAVRMATPGAVRILPRVKPGSAVVHLVNWHYDDTRDGVESVKNAKVMLKLQALGVAGATEARLYTPDNQPVTFPIEQAAVTVPELGLWAVLELRGK
jgi:hypothetical protein